MITKLILFLTLAAFVAIAVIVLLVALKRKKRNNAEEEFTSGLEAMLVRDWRTAATHLQRVVQQDSEQVRAYIKLGQVYRELGEIQRALKIHRELTVRGGLQAETMARIHCEYARDLILAGQPEPALKAVDKALESNRRSAEAFKLRLKLLEQLGRWDAAHECARRLEAVTSKDLSQRRALILVESAREVAASGKGRAARVKCKDAIKLYSACAPAYLLIGDTYEQEGRIDEAIVFWTKLPFAAPRYASLVFDRLERVLFEQGRFGEIESFYRKVIDSNPQNSDGYLRMAGFQERKGNFDEAFKVLDLGREQVEADMDLVRMQIRLLAKRKNFNELSRCALEFTERMFHRHQQYKCETCGALAAEAPFRCPTCGSWESYQRQSAS